MDKYIEFNKALGAGDILRRERLRQKLTIEDVSQKIHVNKHYLRDLEQNNLHLVLQDVYIIGFARSYAEFLGINGNDIVNQLKKDIKNVTSHDMMEVITPKRKFPVFFVGLGIIVCMAIVIIYVTYHSFFVKKEIVSPIKVTSHIPTATTKTPSHNIPQANAPFSAATTTNTPSHIPTATTKTPSHNIPQANAPFSVATTTKTPSHISSKNMNIFYVKKTS